MFGSLGFPELIFIFLLALLIFGPKKMPELGRTLGKAMAEFRKATTDLKRTINAELMEQEMRDADPRKIVRDSLREAKTSLENAVRADDAKATTAAAASAVAATAEAATAAPVAVAGEDASEAAPPSEVASVPAADPPAGTSSPPEAESSEAGTVEPAGVVARGMALEEDPGEETPSASQPAATS